MIKVTKLGHAAFDTPDVDGMVDYYERVLGLTEVARGDGGEVYLRNDVDHHSVVLVSGAEAAFRHVAFQIGGGMSAAEAAEDLKGRGVEAQVLSDSQPGIPELVELADPDGYRLLLYPEIELNGDGYSKRGVCPEKIGHVALFVDDVERTTAFYGEHLGFRFSDQLADFFVFLRCGPDHHSMNFLRNQKRGMQHMGLQVRDMAHVQAASDVLAAAGIPLLWGPGRHGMGHNVFTYHRDPDGNIVELFCELDSLLHEDLGYFEPRPWHEDFPQRPKVWPFNPAAANKWGPPPPEGFLT